MSDIISITQTLNDPDNFKKDISAAAALAAQHFREKYISPINSLYAEQKNKCLAKPSPQAVLLQACRPFVGNTGFIDKMIDGIAGFNAIIQIMQDNYDKIVTSKNKETDSSVHEDGVYDVDKECTVFGTANVGQGDKFVIILLLLMAFARI